MTKHERSTTVLVVGSTGSIGSLVVAECLRRGFVTRALVRDRSSTAHVPPGARMMVGDLTHLDDILDEAVEGVDAVIFAAGARSGKEECEAVDYGGVRNILAVLDRYPARIVLMSMLGVTDRNSERNRRTEAGDWKRRAERLVRASGRPYVIVRPGWFDYHAADQHHIVLEQGDAKRGGGPQDGTVSRRQVARVLVECVTSPSAVGKTFELVARTGDEQEDLEPLFADLRPDEPGGLDGVLDEDNMPVEEEPRRIQVDLDMARTSLKRPLP